MIEQYINENKNLIYSICSKYNNYYDKEDLYQQGVIGIINAYNNYDKNKNVKFSTYAFPYIVGEVNNYVRENKNIKVSKDLIRLGRKINEYIEKHKQVRGFEPSIGDISQMLNLSKEKIVFALNCLNTVKSTDDIISNNGKEITLLDITASKDKISKEQILDLKDSFKYLNSDEKKIIINRYFNNLTQNEIAKIMDVNQVYISRLEKKALVKMKKYMS